jgi:signal transduction histidine kinase
VEGPVTFVGKEGRGAYLEISSETGYMQVNVTRGNGYLTDLLPGSRIRARGICTAVHGGTEGKFVCNLQVSNLNDIVILQLPEEVWQRYPRRPIDALAQTNLAGHIVHLRGKVKSVQAGASFLLADETGRTVVNSRQAVLETGDRDVEALCSWQQRGSNRVVQCLFARLLTGATNQTSLPTLTTTEQIRWLKPDEARQQQPVKVRGVITFIMTRRGGIVGGTLQDGTGGVFLWELWNANLTGTNAEPKPGDFCEIEGLTSSGDFSPIVLCRKLTILGESQFPEPARPNWEELVGGGLDAQWVEVRGLVSSATNIDMEIGMKGGHILCSLRGKGTETYLGDIVRVRGVVFVYHDSARHITNMLINVPSPRFISVETPVPEDPFLTPINDVRDLFTYNPGEPDFRRVKIAGQVVHVRNDVCYVMSGTNGVRLIPKGAAKSAVGDLVEAVGFPNIDSPFNGPLLTLRDATIRTTGRIPLPAVIKIAPDDLLDREHDSTLVQVESQLLGVSLYQAEQVLELQSGSTVYRARLNTIAGKLPPLREGSRLAVAGVYVVSSDKSVPFELLLNSPSDIRVLELPSWWTTRHTFIVVCIMALLILLSVIWIGMLHQQVAKRTQSLKNEVAERKRTEDELVRTRLQHLVELERTRIARDLHDDLGSSVTRVVLLLDELTLQDRLPAQNAAAHPAEISTAAREIIQSLDETVWAVNPRNDTLPHLIDYLGQFAIEFMKVANVLCRLDFPDHPPARVISTEVRHNLYMAVKEALNNAVRHAQATEVWLRVAVAEESLRLVVEDNGSGFEQVVGHSSANGLRNMRQRMEDIGGHFEIESAVKKGTKVTLTFFWSSGK